jgi:hypothetical protein
MLIITGPGRSGTSVLALFCKEMGFDPGGEWYDSVDAGLENERVVKINDALRREARETGGTAQSLRLYAEEIRQMRIDVIKDPRFTMHPALLRAWSSVRDDISVLVTYRHPEHCVASHQRRAKFVMERRGMQPDDIRCRMADCVETLLTLEIPFELVLFPEFLGQCDQVCDKLQTLGLEIDRPRAARVWAQVVDCDKVHIGRPALKAERRGVTGIQQRVVRLSQRVYDVVLHNSTRALDHLPLKRRE